MIASWSADEWTAAGTWAYAAIAAVAALFVYRQVSEMRRTREEEARPYVVVDIVPGSVSFNLLNLVISNIGNTPARDVRLKFDPPISSALAAVKLASSSLVVDGVAHLPPGRTITLLFDDARKRASAALPTRYEVEVTGKDSRGQPLPTVSYVLDLGTLLGQVQVDEYGVHHAAKALRDIAGLLRSVSGSESIRVMSSDQDAARLRDDIHFDFTGEYPHLGSAELPPILMSLGRSTVVRTIVRHVREARSKRRDTQR